MRDLSRAAGSPEPVPAELTFELNVLLTLLITPGEDVPLVFLDDPARTPLPDTPPGADPVTALLSACLQAGLSLATTAGDLMVPMIPGWRATLDPAGTFAVHRPLDGPTQPFCWAERVDAPPGWRDAAAALRHVVLFAGSIGVAPRGRGTVDMRSLHDRLPAAAGAGMLVAGLIGYRPGPEPA